MAHKLYLLFDIAGVLIIEYGKSVRWLKKAISIYIKELSKKHLKQRIS